MPSEVKAVLERLQRISAEPASVGLHPAAGGVARPARALTRRMVIVAILIAATLASILGAGYAFIGLERLAPPTPMRRPAAPATSSAEPPKPAPALQVAMGLMTTGRVQAAREQLLRIVAEDSADAAWALARSYDPNFLNTIPAADAGPDIGEATRWYRAWYAISVKQGLVADSVSVERIISSMR